MKLISSKGYRKDGFTMLELIIVLSILAITSAIAVPQYSQWRASTASRQVAWEIKHKMRFVRERAITTNRQTRFELQIQGGRYRLMQSDFVGGATVWAPIEPWKPINPETSLATGQDCTGNADVNVGFNPNGSAAVMTYICINDSTGADRFTLLVNRTNGSIKIR